MENDSFYVAILKGIISTYIYSMEKCKTNLSDKSSLYTGISYLF